MTTKPNFLKLTTLIILFTLQLQAQTTSPDLFSQNSWELINRTSEIENEKGKKAIFLNEAPGDGAMVLKDYQFSSGTIELDIKGKDLMGQSFVGVAFHAKDKDTYDAIYFRPFNFSNADTARRSRAVQYVSMPNYPWEKLRNDSPGKYENKVKPAPDPNDWFHVKITIKEKQIKVFVNNEVKPCMEVQKLTDVNKGSLALWVGNNSSGSFANLKITPESGSENSLRQPSRDW